MKINCNYIDNSIIFDDDKINVIEIENKKIFYRFVRDLYSISNGDVLEEFVYLNNNNIEINLVNKIKIINNYFDFDFTSKKYGVEIIKKLVSNINDEDKDAIIVLQNRIYQKVNKQLQKFDIPLFISNDIDIGTVLKNLKIEIKEYNNILNNLFLLIDIEKTFNLSNILIFINLKQYLSDKELKELYKYSIYNSVKILLVDSQHYNNVNNFEKKLYIDTDLVEFMI